jgi:hypothetical protein
MAVHGAASSGAVFAPYRPSLAVLLPLSDSDMNIKTLKMIVHWQSQDSRGDGPVRPTPQSAPSQLNRRVGLLAGGWGLPLSATGRTRPGS